MMQHSEVLQMQLKEQQLLDLTQQSDGATKTTLSIWLWFSYITLQQLAYALLQLFGTHYQKQSLLMTLLVCYCV